MIIDPPRLPHPSGTQSRPPSAPSGGGASQSLGSGTLLPQQPRMRMYESHRSLWAPNGCLSTYVTISIHMRESHRSLWAPYDVLRSPHPRLWTCMIVHAPMCESHPSLWAAHDQPPPHPPGTQLCPPRPLTGGWPSPVLGLGEQTPAPPARPRPLRFLGIQARPISDADFRGVWGQDRNENDLPPPPEDQAAISGRGGGVPSGAGRGGEPAHATPDLWCRCATDVGATE